MSSFLSPNELEIICLEAVKQDGTALKFVCS